MKNILKKIEEKNAIKSNYNYEDEIKSIENLEIEIENDKKFFPDEIELIRQGAILTYDPSLRTGVKQVIYVGKLRGLKYKDSKKDKNGKVKKVIFKENMDRCTISL